MKMQLKGTVESVIFLGGSYELEVLLPTDLITLRTVEGNYRKGRLFISLYHPTATGIFNLNSERQLYFYRFINL
jgi:hypothetical protein